MTGLDLVVIISDVLKELQRQDVKWGPDRDLGGLLWAAVLTEEIGEVSEAVLKRQYGELRAELVQVAAVCFQWIANMDRYTEQGRLEDWPIRGSDELNTYRANACSDTDKTE